MEQNKPDDSSTNQGNTIKYGDVNQDGEINAFNCTLIQDYRARTVNLNEQQLKNADVNVDNIVDSFDCGTIKEFLARYVAK